KARARSILGDWLERGDVDDFYIGDQFADAVDLLLKDGTAESRNQARRVFSNQRLRSGAGWFWTRPCIMRRCAEAGMTDPYHFYLQLLENNRSKLIDVHENGKDREASTFHPNGAEECTHEIVKKFAYDDPEVKKIVAKFPKTV